MRKSNNDYTFEFILVFRRLDVMDRDAGSRFISYLEEIEEHNE